MLNRHSAHDQHGDVGPKVTRRRRRSFAAWLLLGWVAFWLTTMAQACAVDAMPRPLSSNTAALTHEPAEQAGFPDRQSDPAPCCHDLTAPPDLLTAAVTAIADRFDSVTPVLVAAEAHVVRQQAYALNTARTGVAPLSQVPLYLRNQRFLI
jgi:hypothetical protein